MGALCGVIDLCEKSELLDISGIINSYDMSDDFTSINNKNYNFAGWVHKIRPCDHNALPIIINEGKGYVIIADAKIDNRNDLIQKHSESLSKDSSDIEIFNQLYNDFGDKCFKGIYGSYSVVIYDYMHNEAKLIKDHIGNRSLYYKLENGVLIFSTTIKGMKSYKKKRFDLNEKWLVNYLHNEDQLSEFNGIETAYKDIYQVESANILTISKEHKSSKKYWCFGKRKNIRYKSDVEYEKHMYELFYKIMEDQIEGVEGVGVSLSGGIDSACIAGTLNEMEDVNFLALTSIPSSTYKGEKEKHFIADESEDVQYIIDKCKRMTHFYERSEGMNSYNSIDKLLEIMEQPYGALDNLFWINNVSEILSAKGAKVNIEGSWGNNTFSANGDYILYLNTFVNKFRWIKFIREVYVISDFTGIGRRFLVLETLKRKLPLFIRRRFMKNANAKSVIKDSIIEAFELTSFYKKHKFGQYRRNNLTMENFLGSYYDDRILSFAGNSHTQSSLKYGMYEIDPSSDVRMIEFCSGIPFTQFIKNGRSRSLVRRAFDGIAPSEILNNFDHRGWQSADFIHRHISDLDAITLELKSVYANDFMNEILNREVVDELSDKLSSSKKLEVLLALRTMLRIIIVKRFVEKNEE